MTYLGERGFLKGYDRVNSYWNQFKVRFPRNEALIWQIILKFTVELVERVCNQAG